MSDLFLLLKTNLINGLSLNKIFQKQIKKGSLVGMITVGSLIVLGLLLFSFFYMFMFGTLFNDAGIPEAILTLAISAGSILCFITTIFQANSFLFRTKDFELLMSTPLKPSVVVTSKLLSLFVYSLAFMLLMYIPCLVVYAIYTTTNFIFWLTAILMIFLLPIIPVIAGSLVAYLLGFIPIPHKLKNALSIILSIAFICVIFFLGFNVGETDEEMIQMMKTLYETLKKAYFLGEIAISGQMGNVIHLLIFVGISLVSLLVFIYIISKTFLLANTVNRVNKPHRDFNESVIEKSKESSVVMAIFKKECKVYFGIPGYVLNTIVGPIMSIIFLVSYIVSSQDVVSTPEIGVMIKELNIVMLLIIVGLSCTMTTTTASSISIEGKNFWILKSAPVKAKDVLTAKLLVNMIIVIPIIVIDVIVAAALWDANILALMVVLISGIAQCIALSSIGLYINVLFPKFEYDNPIKVIKQSKSVFLIMVISLLAFGIIGIATFVLTFIIGIVSILFNLVLSLALALIGLILLYKIGVKKYEAINV